MIYYLYSQLFVKKSGVFNDLGSGGNIDVCVVTKDGKDHIRKFRSPNNRAYHADFKPFPKGKIFYTLTIDVLVFYTCTIDIVV